MQLPTLAHVRQTMPRLSQSAAVRYLPLLQAACAEFDIGTPARVAAFLAQVAHESGELRYWEEIWGPTPAQLAYEPPGPKANDLGNTETGDGALFKGHGPIQITGRRNHEKAGRALGLDLVRHPELAATPEHGFRVAAWVFSTFGCNDKADLETEAAFVSMTRRINGGLNGLVERVRYHLRARRAMGLKELGR